MACYSLSVHSKWKVFLVPSADPHYNMWPHANAILLPTEHVFRVEAILNQLPLNYCWRFSTETWKHYAKTSVMQNSCFQACEGRLFSPWNTPYANCALGHKGASLGGLALKWISLISAPRDLQSWPCSRVAGFMRRSHGVRLVNLLLVFFCRMLLAVQWIYLLFVQRHSLPFFCLLVSIFLTWPSATPLCPLLDTHPISAFTPFTVCVTLLLLSSLDLFWCASCPKVSSL